MTESRNWREVRRVPETLSEFLLDRIAKDEATASSVHDLYDCVRVLAEVQAKRRIVEDCSRKIGPILEFQTGVFAEMILEHLALPYADHPDFRDEWRA